MLTASYSFSFPFVVPLSLIHRIMYLASQIRRPIIAWNKGMVIQEAIVEVMVEETTSKGNWIYIYTSVSQTQTYILIQRYIKLEHLFQTEQLYSDFLSHSDCIPTFNYNNHLDQSSIHTSCPFIHLTIHPFIHSTIHPFT